MTDYRAFSRDDFVEDIVRIAHEPHGSKDLFIVFRSILDVLELGKTRLDDLEIRLLMGAATILYRHMMIDTMEGTWH